MHECTCPFGYVYDTPAHHPSTKGRQKTEGAGRKEGRKLKERRKLKEGKKEGRDDGR
jgi:hypothetical protein